MNSIVPDWASIVATQLGFGRDNARTIGDIQERLNVPRRTVEAAIEQLRRSGSPVCTGSDGAWLTDSATELRQHADALRSRAVTVMLGARALRATARRYERSQQLRLAL